ncbi:hypothetical protein HXX76_000330 [Chlamydomonas incerta]|uniref:AB hydrolase-1 domain-containing protein n=1 Tax=Chlamydomonas incerta TaxID=51695 RepID=A0A835WDX4_CHLIN|nr:hypothetical protein HXX76_000330 [Chlamydomonas incerta]|eukprot:KAG2445724.1 hypothetical protein HXX76_000330 [Chlamydomonas incerta]
MPTGGAASTGAAQNTAGANHGAGAGNPRPVVLLQHGLLDSAAGYLVNGPGRSLAFILADEGYDVWLGNVRGNSLSRAHVSLTPDDAAFWMWSYDEMAVYDLPAMVRYILSTSGAASLRYVGHSQGTTVLLAALAGPMVEPAAAEPPAAELLQAGVAGAEAVQAELALAEDARTGSTQAAAEAAANAQAAAAEAAPGAVAAAVTAGAGAQAVSRRRLRAARSRGRDAGAMQAEGRGTISTDQHRSSTAAAADLGAAGRQATTTAATGAALRPRPRAATLEAGLIERAALLAPVALAKHISSVPLLAMAAMDTDDMFSLLGLHEFLPSQQLVAALEGALCAVQPALCVSFLAALCGYNPDNLDNARLPLYLSYTPAGTSVQNMAHWAQAVRSRVPNSMSYFDYGTDCAGGRTGRCNQLEYGRLSAPHYNLTAITTPLALFSGSKDRLSDPLDMEYLVESLAPGVVRAARVLPAYEHLDFIWGIDAREELYGDVLRFLAGEDL